MVMDSDLELMADPKAALARFCSFAGVEFDPAMLSWTPQVGAERRIGGRGGEGRG